MRVMHRRLVWVRTKPVKLTLLGKRPRYAQVESAQTLLEAINKAGCGIGQSCRGEGICRACKVQVLHGEELLCPPTASERAAQLAVCWRLACQALVPTTDACKADNSCLVVWHPQWGHALPDKHPTTLD